MQYYYTAVRMAKMEKTDHTNCWWGCGATEIECKNGTPNLENRPTVF